MNTLKAEKRHLSTKAKQLRREGFVTGNVFGKNMPESIPVRILKTDAERLLKTCSKGSRITLNLDNENYPVLVKEIDYNPVKGRIDEIDFQVLVNGEMIHSTAEIVLLNHEKVSVGLVEQLLHEISYKATPANLVDEIKVDVGDMKLGDTIKVSDLDIAKNKNIHLITSADSMVAVVAEVHNAPVPETDAETAGTEA